MSRPWLNSGHVCGRKLTIPSVDVEAMSAAAYQTITSVSAMSAAYQNKNIAKQIWMRVGGRGISSAQYMTLLAVNAIPSAREIDSQSED